MIDPEADWPDGRRLNIRALMKEQDARISEVVDELRGEARWDTRELAGEING